MALGKTRLDVAGMTARFHLTSKQDYRLMGGHSERDQIEAFLALLRDGDVVYDVGAHMGTWTAFVAQRVGRGHVHGFEPEPRNAERLRAKS